MIIKVHLFLVGPLATSHLQAYSSSSWSGTLCARCCPAPGTPQTESPAVTGLASTRSRRRSLCDLITVFRHFCLPPALLRASRGSGHLLGNPQGTVWGYMVPSAGDAYLSLQEAPPLGTVGKGRKADTCLATVIPPGGVFI